MKTVKLAFGSGTMVRGVAFRDLFLLTWNERGGPRVDQPPGSEGFGSPLAHATVKGQLGGEISRDWKPEGLTIRLSVPCDRLID